MRIQISIFHTAQSSTHSGDEFSLTEKSISYKESRDNGQNVLLPLWVCNGTGTFVFHFVHCYVHGRAQQAQSAGASQPAAAEPSAVTVARSPPTPLQYHTGKRAKRLSAAAASAADANTAE